MKDRAFESLRNLVLIETTPEQCLAILRRGTVSTNSFLRKLHNLARRMKWLPDDILVRGMWPVLVNRDNATRRGKAFGCLVDVGELRFLVLRSAEKPFSALILFWQLGC